MPDNEREFWTKKTPELFRKIIQGITNGIGEFQDDNWIDMLTLFKQLGFVDDDDIINLMNARKAVPLLDAFLYVWTFFTFIQIYIGTTGGILGGTYRQNMNKLYSPNPPNPESILRAGFIAPEKINKVRDAMKRNGLSDDDIDLMFLANYALYPMEQIRDLYWRGVLDIDKVYERMRELGFTDTRIEEIMQSWDRIPSPQDLFWMVAHEAFEPDTIERLGLEDEFPEEQIDWIKANGLSEYWARKYWIAHWAQPSIEQVYRMFHRGLVSYDELWQHFKVVEIPPYWRDKLIQLAYEPYTRVDVRRMHALGVLSDEELVRAYMDLGYDEEKATKLAIFTIRYNQGSKKELTKDQILQGYKRKLLDRNETVDLLTSIDYTRDEAEFLVILEDQKEQLEIQDEIIENIKDRYVNNLITREQALSSLSKMGLAGQRINVLLDRWEIQRYKDRKLPSKNDLEKLLNYGIINPDIYRREMSKLGYSWEQTEWYLRLAKAKVKPPEERKKIKKLSVTQLKQSYIDGDITREEFKQYLLDKGYLNSDAELIISHIDDEIEAKQKKLEKETEQRELSRRDLERSFKQGLISKDNFINGLIKIGYSRDDARLIAETIVNIMKEEVAE